jgi:hypothetical protein
MPIVSAFGSGILHDMKHIVLFLAALAPFVAACTPQATGLPPLGVAAEKPAAVEEDTCGAARFAHLVGQPKSVVDRTTFPDGTRVILPDMAVTMDYREDRLNVLIDGNATVERVYCG